MPIESFSGCDRIHDLFQPSEPPPMLVPLCELCLPASPITTTRSAYPAVFTSYSKSISQPLSGRCKVNRSRSKSEEHHCHHHHHHYHRHHQIFYLNKKKLLFEHDREHQNVTLFYRDSDVVFLVVCVSLAIKRQSCFSVFFAEMS